MRPKLLEFRVTKYDPSFRNTLGHYTRPEWTAVSDIGQAFDGKTLTEEEYKRTEDAYAAVAIEFVREAGIQSLTVTSLENHFGAPISIPEGATIALSEVELIVRRVLREEFWCRLVATNGFVHIGHDYYMYVGVSHQCPGAQQLAYERGLFVEPFRSPLHEIDS